MTESNPLPVINRLITTHNTEGKAIFSDAVAPVTDPKPVDNGRAMFGLHYWSEQFPVEMNQEQDIKTYQRYMGEAPGLVISTGTVLRTAGKKSRLSSDTFIVLILRCRHDTRLAVSDASDGFARLWYRPGG